MADQKPVRILIVGAGGRGFAYARYAQMRPDEAQVVGVAEPRDDYRNRMAEMFHIPSRQVFRDWQEPLAMDAFADAVVIATPDALHTAPAIAYANHRVAILLEKPMAPTADECRQIVQAVNANQIIFGVCHVMRYTSYTQKLKALLEDGKIGEVVSVQHLEPVGYWHQAHSFVRGNWRNSAESSFMLLAKSCHDIDWLRYIIGRPCEKVSSFGSLSHFKKDQKPADAKDAIRCLDCAYEPRCPYSAKKLYFGALQRGHLGWPLDVITGCDPSEIGEERVRKALEEGPYGRCVYECDNDVVDHQVVNLLYAGGVTASFTMTAFSEQTDRRTVIFGTLGELRGNGDRIEIYNFLTDQTEVIETCDRVEMDSGHGGGDFGVMRSFVRAVASGDRSYILSGADETLESHLTVFAAEESRISGNTLTIQA